MVGYEGVEGVVYKALTRVSVSIANRWNSGS
jgi:hypothetical protein